MNQKTPLTGGDRQLVADFGIFQNISDDSYKRGYDAGYTAGENAGENAGYAAGHTAGQQTEYDRFWDAYQQSGNRTDYTFAFGGNGWTDGTFKPKYTIAPVGNAAVDSMFYKSAITTIPDDVLDFSKVTYCYMTFRSSRLVKSPPLNLSNCTQGTNWMFGNCGSLREIGTITVNEALTYQNFFYYCSALENVTFDGVIGKDISLQWSPLLSDASVQSIIDHLKDLTGATSQTLTFRANVGAKLTDEQKATVTAKNWTLVY